MIEYLMLTFIVGFGAGMFAHKKIFKGEELNADICLDYLRSKGYWTRINIGPNGGKNERA